jgi:hypothetical protein
MSAAQKEKKLYYLTEADSSGILTIRRNERKPVTIILILKRHQT